MNDALSRLMDLIALGTSVAVAIVLAIFYYKKAKRRLRAVPLFFLLLGPVAIAVHMAMHFIGVGMVATRKISAGSFTYDFRFYSLLLMAGVLSVLSFQLIKQSQPGFLRKRNNARQRLVTCGWIVLVAAPTIPFTFIGSLPVQAVVIHLAAAYFVVKKSAEALRPIEAPVMAKNAVA
jgi:hypothetical protein